MDNNQNLISSIEALFFVYGEPIEIKKISKILNEDENAIIDAIAEFSKSLESRGLMVIFNDGKAQLATKPEFSNFLESFAKEEFSENLTPAALETLALIAYRGPLSRAQIDYFRGVNSSFTLRSLLMRGLIEKTSATENQERGYFYQISFDLMKYLGISKIEELPEYEKFKNEIIRQEEIKQETDKIKTEEQEKNNAI